MAEAPPSPEDAVAGFWFILSWVLILLSGESVLARHSLSIEAILLFTLGVLFYIASIKWQKIKLKIGERRGISLLLSTPKFRRGLLSLGLLYVLFNITMYLYLLREDLNKYVMPRTLTKEQTEKLKKELLAHPCDTVVKIYSNVTDDEASRYAQQIYSAMKAGGWNASFEQVLPWTQPSLQHERREFDSSMTAIERGVSIYTCFAGQPPPSDPKHPPPHESLVAAFQEAGIGGGGGGANDCGQYWVNVIVGPKPHPFETPPTLWRIGQWLMNISH